MALAFVIVRFADLSVGVEHVRRRNTDATPGRSPVPSRKQRLHIAFVRQ